MKNFLIPVNFLLKTISFCLVILLSPLHIAVAETARQEYTPPPTPVSSSGLLQVIFSLLLVLGAVMLVAWLLKRINLPQNSNSKLLKVISGVTVGQRERIVLVEIDKTWLVVGVAPGQVRTLHSMEKIDLPRTDSTNISDSDNKFQGWLKQVLEKRNAS